MTDVMRFTGECRRPPSYISLMLICLKVCCSVMNIHHHASMHMQYSCRIYIPRHQYPSACSTSAAIIMSSKIRWTALSNIERIRQNDTITASSSVQQ